MKKILFLLLFCSSYILPNNINTELNEAIKNSDYDTLVQIFKENQLSEKEKVMYFELANDIYIKRSDSGVLIQTASGAFRVMNEYEMKEHDKVVGSKVLHISLSLASLISTAVSLIAACNPENQSGTSLDKTTRIASAALGLSSLATLVYSLKKLNDIQKNISEKLEMLRENSLKIRQFIILSIDHK